MHRFRLFYIYDPNLGQQLKYVLRGLPPSIESEKVKGKGYRHFSCPPS
jgi:hypothetical protein